MIPSRDLIEHEQIKGGAEHRVICTPNSNGKGCKYKCHLLIWTRKPGAPTDKDWMASILVTVNYAALGPKLITSVGKNLYTKVFSSTSHHEPEQIYGSDYDDEDVSHLVQYPSVVTHRVSVHALRNWYERSDPIVHTVQMNPPNYHNLESEIIADFINKVLL